MTTFTYLATDESATERLGQALAAALPDGIVVALEGTLGAGKTRLVQALAAACGVDRGDVLSPTFVLCHEYHGARTLYHLDAYRVRDTAEFVALGVDELFAAPAMTLIEWADRVVAALPADFLRIAIEITGPEQRTFQISTVGLLDPALPDKIAARLPR